MTTTDDLPDAEMMAPVTRIARFIGSGGASSVSGAFADTGVTIIENFPPFVFAGADAVEAWSRGMRAHLSGLSDLRHVFGPAHNFSRAGDDAFFSLPTTWHGVANGQAFSEDGGWAFVLRREHGEWRVAGYGWAVTALRAG